MYEERKLTEAEHEAIRDRDRRSSRVMLVIVVVIGLLFLYVMDNPNSFNQNTPQGGNGGYCDNVGC